MNIIKDYIRNELELETIDYEHNETEYLITPMFVIIKQDDEYLISFEIDSSKDVALNLYVGIQNHFLNEIYFKVYDDAVIKVDEYGKLKYFVFGNEARGYYYNEIYDNIKLQQSIPKDTVYH